MTKHTLAKFNDVSGTHGRSVNKSEKSVTRARVREMGA